jgi:hypothetical protein
MQGESHRGGPSVRVNVGRQWDSSLLGDFRLVEEDYKFALSSLSHRKLVQADVTL